MCYSRLGFLRISKWVPVRTVHGTPALGMGSKMRPMRIKRSRVVALVVIALVVVAVLYVRANYFSIPLCVVQPSADRGCSDPPR
jgi:hypothetical protein